MGPTRGSYTAPCFLLPLEASKTSSVLTCTMSTGRQKENLFTSQPEPKPNQVFQSGFLAEAQRVKSLEGIFVFRTLCNWDSMLPRQNFTEKKTKDFLKDTSRKKKQRWKVALIASLRINRSQENWLKQASNQLTPRAVNQMLTGALGSGAAHTFALSLASQRHRRRPSWGGTVSVWMCGGETSNRTPWRTLQCVSLYEVIATFHSARPPSPRLQEAVVSIQTGWLRWT